MHRGQERYAGIQRELSKLYRATGGKKHWGDYRSFQRSEAARNIWRNGNAGTSKESDFESRLHSVPQNNGQLEPESTKPSKVLNRGQERYAGIQRELSKLYRATGGKKHWGDYTSFQRSDAARNIWRNGNAGVSKESDFESRLHSVPQNNGQLEPEFTKPSKVLNRGQERYAGIQKELSKLYRATGGKKHWGDYRSFQRSEAARNIWRKGNAGTSNKSDPESKPESASENNVQRSPDPASAEARTTDP